MTFTMKRRLFSTIGTDRPTLDAIRKYSTALALLGGAALAIFSAGGYYWRLHDTLERERNVREKDVAHERELRQVEIKAERDLRQVEIKAERDLRHSDKIIAEKALAVGL